MDYLVTIDDTEKYMLALLIQGRLTERCGLNMLVGPQPDLLAPSNYTHTEMDDRDKIKVCFIADDAAELRKSGEAFSQMVLATYESAPIHTTTIDAFRDDLDRQLNVFVDELVMSHFRSDALNRLAVDNISIEKKNVLRIVYRIDTKPLFQLHPSRFIIAHTMKYTENLWAVRSQTVTCVT